MQREVHSFKFEDSETFTPTQFLVDGAAFWSTRGRSVLFAGRREEGAACSVRKKENVNAWHSPSTPLRSPSVL